MNKVPLAGVIGAPIDHSLSPRLHGAWLSQYGLAGHYVPLHIDPPDLADCLRALPRMGFRGVNVTLPHKEAALALADQVSDQAARIGAANTLTCHENGQIHADNTDAYGFIANLQQNAPDWDAARAPALVLGAGGAARAVIVALLDAGVPELHLTNRSPNRSYALAQEFGPRVVVVDWQDRAQALKGSGTLVNTTSLGMHGQPALDIDLSLLPLTALVTDIVYKPLVTPLLRDAAARGHRVVDGLGMLLHQGVPGFERWFGIRPDVTPALREAVLA